MQIAPNIRNKLTNSLNAQPNMVCVLLILFLQIFIAFAAASLITFLDASSNSAFAQDDDDDDDDGGGGGGGGPGGEDGGAVGQIEGNIDNGENVGPRDNPDCFEEVALLPPWLRDCDRPETSRQPVVVVPGDPVRRGTADSLPGERRDAQRDTNPPNTLPNEIIVARAAPGELTALENRGFVALSRSPRPLAVGDLVRFEVPAGFSTAEGLALARQLAPNAIIDYNHIYRPAQVACDSAFCRQRRAIRWPEPPAVCELPATIGMIDTSIDASAPALSGQTVQLLNGVSSGRDAAASDHGTAIASLLLGRREAAVPGLLPKGKLVAVQAFHVAATGEDIADTFDIVSSIDMMVKTGTKVINLSFTGPNNKVLAEMVRRAVADDAVLVAAAGNLGPSGPVVYPAGYESVVAVTAVGDDLRVYRGANRGNYIDFAAPGVDVQVVSARTATEFKSGTSFAAPFVAAALAAAKTKKPAQSIPQLVASLQVSATDLGRSGRDTVFGWGLVQVPDICQ